MWNAYALYMFVTETNKCYAVNNLTLFFGRIACYRGHGCRLDKVQQH